MTNDNDDDDDDDDDDDEAENSNDNVPSLVRRFDEICFSFGDSEAIELIETTTSSNNEEEEVSSTSICYFELQEHSKALANQLYYRYRPDYVLIDCQNWAIAEAVSTLACMRIQVPFVPVSCYDWSPGRLNSVVQLLRDQEQQNDKNSWSSPSFVVAVTVCDNDQDPILSVFQQAGVHQILYLDSRTGSLREQLNVPDDDIVVAAMPNKQKDDLYVLFTSGSTTSIPKAVVGSHSATYHRIHWFLREFVPSSPRVGRRSKLTFVDGVNELWTSLLDIDSSVLITIPPLQLQQYGIAAIYDKCTQLLLLPSQLHQMLLLPTKSHSLDRVLISGEVCSTSLVREFRSIYKDGGAELINLYGQTESTGDVCCAVLVGRNEKWKNTNDNDIIQDNCVTIGKPILDSIRIEILPDNKELIIHGASQLANGYLTSNGDDDGVRRRCDRRVPFTSFATGDVGFFRNDGCWYIKGRIDDVQKINGIWTSPAEIDSVFSQIYHQKHIINHGKHDVDAHTATMTTVVVVVDHAFFVLTTSQQCCKDFSRMEMHQKYNIPWNLIPANVFYCPYPIPIMMSSGSGAGKIDRRACQDIVRNHLKNKKKKNDQPQETLETSTTTFLSLVCKVLGIQESALDSSKSFVELGGDSATSITLFYLMRTTLLQPDGTELHANMCHGMTALDLLNDEGSVQEMQDRILLSSATKNDDGSIDRKRRKFSSSSSIVRRRRFKDDFKPKPFIRHSTSHTSIPLQACVDATPLIVLLEGDEERFVYAACQGGVIVKCNLEGSTTILAYTQLRQGWMIQADLILYSHPRQEEKQTLMMMIVACAYQYDSLGDNGNKGLVVALSLDLKTELWKYEFDGAIKATPVLIGNDLWVQGDGKVEVLNVQTGKNDRGMQVQLPHPAVAKPIVLPIRRANDGRHQHQSVAYASSDWESCLMIVSETGTVRKILDSEIGPVHKDPYQQMDDKNSSSSLAYVSDSYGAMHLLQLLPNDSVITIQETFRLSSHPLSPPLPVDSQTCVVGGQDGIVYCCRRCAVMTDADTSLTVRWKCSVGAAVYARPALLRNNDGTSNSTTNDTIVVVTTTAGDIVALDVGTGTIQWKHRVPAEIWSDLQISRTTSKNDFVLLFGARDSSLYFYRPTPI
eukprot:scaffold586_cov68-Cylindrotheca_fusiformis.AAC.12